MKKLITVIIGATILYSCQKDIVTPVKPKQLFASRPDSELLNTWFKISNQSDNFTDSADRRLFKKIYSEWTTQMTNFCYPEIIQIDGTIMWSSKTYEKDGLIYRIGAGDVRRVTGIGLTSGLIYKGDGGSNDTLLVYPDNSSIGYSSFKATWTTSQGNQIIFNDRSEYYFYADGSGGRITSVTQNDTCK